MFLRYGILADHVLPAGNGKWNVIGTMNVIRARSWPAVHSRMGILLRIEADHREIGEHTLQIDFVDGMGNQVGTVSEKAFNLKAPETEGFPIGLELGAEIHGLKIPGSGNYDFVVRIDGRYIDSVPLYARDVPKSESS
jgi:hypothetical protein